MMAVPIPSLALCQASAFRRSGKGELEMVLMRRISLMGSPGFRQLISACVIALLVTAMTPLDALAIEYRFVAHQGKVSQDYKGNTIPAFKQAAETEGIFGLETDIWRTADGEYVCLHGEDSGEASGGPKGATWAGMNIWNTKSSTLRTKKSGGYVLPLLGEYLDICREGGKWAFIEIKNPELAEDPSYAREVVRIVNEHGMLDNCVFVSWRGRAKAVYYLKQCAIDDYGVNALGHIGTGQTNELVDASYARALEYGLDGIGTYPDIAQQEYAYNLIKGSGLTLRSSGAIKNEAHARELIEKYDLWAAYCEFKPTLPISDAADSPTLSPAFDQPSELCESVKLSLKVARGVLRVSAGITDL